MRKLTILEARDGIKRGIVDAAWGKNAEKVTKIINKFDKKIKFKII